MKKPTKIFLVLLSSVLLLAGVIGTTGCMFTDDSNSVKSYAVNKTITFAKVKYTVTETIRSATLNDIAAPEDYEYLTITVKIENTVNNRMTFNQLCWRYVDTNHIERDCLNDAQYQTSTSMGAGAIVAKNSTPFVSTISFLVKTGETGLINFYFTLDSLVAGFAIDLSKK
ncbi:MAG: DUF4352 domain-containing protein [Chloroflexi bacterium]|nr:DUF4352 domain-containing protein [Chloroflexota bacterium]